MADNHWKRPQTTNGLNNYKEVKMSLIIAGGWVMVPLLLISIIVLALIIDRSLSYIWNPLPDADQQKNILEHISPKHLGSKIMLPRSVPVRRCLFTKAY